MLLYKSRKRHKIKKLEPASILFSGFLGLILLGTGLLMIPAATSDRHHLSFIDALFEATSAVCVTGLAVVDTGTTFTLFGQIILLVLIQVGGWGFMTIGILMFIILGKKIGLQQRLILKESLNAFSLQGVIALVRRVVFITLAVEAIGALILAIRWAQEMSWGKAIYYGIFHSISAFNNAGFGLEPDNLSKWVGDPTVNIIITFLFIIGGTGFFVIADILEKRNLRKFSLHTKIVLASTLILNIVSTLVIFTLEYHNADTLGKLSMGDKWWAAYFQGVVPRTAGFNTLDIGELTLSSKVYVMGLMFVGAAPGSTGGGIKVTTFVLILLALWSVLTNKEDINIFQRRIPKSLIYRAFSIATSAMIFVFVIFFLLTITEKGVDMSTILFETISASGTVGLSANFTGDLSPAGRILITIMMFIGRVGPLTIGFVLAIRSNRQSKIRYAEEKILLG
ncbi:TrkH family potassium uptake protein [Priestia filamentosa]|uniref:Ktr system potassium transporter B n=2 Tax=Priestia filamentosa TaxID=1402861 RepID=A0A1X7E9R2_9BACI|nr:TrkH family potassium uptake protein [Priestia filamentosa]AKO92627.1 Ktr system potassium transporter B [Priestia filamentosa]MDT3762707.1 TrkH family potassium uptake protein [Priestia filamentosa]OXS69243.1 Ktr system potassium transporter B [Priestia filamentosa]WCM13808.1 TrkH family potassium uptake protein [Priestia filamentosa]WRU97168.1 TrkH family potassium uptake protein [Priestia filamentosa]